MKLFSSTILLLVLTACNLGSGALATQTTEQPPIAGAAYINLDGTPVPQGRPLLPEDNPPQYPTVPDEARVAIGIPEDGSEHQVDLVEVKQAIRTNDPGRLVGVPNGYGPHGYPLYPAVCSFYPEHSECELSNGQVVDEAYLEAHTTVVRNADVIHGPFICGTLICVDLQGRVIGHVSKTLQAWRQSHCTWVEYGKSSCQ